MPIPNSPIEQLENRLLALHAASIELVSEISIDVLLEKIASVAMEQSNANFAAVGILDEEGNMVRFFPAGMSREEIDQISHTPLGMGLIGELMNTKESIRIANIRTDQRSNSFPPFHPEMVSFLGVPIRQGQYQLGQIYLTNKEKENPFTIDDQRIIEMLAAYAAVAISNARFYKDLMLRDRALTRRNENLALLDQLASTLATSTDIDQILDKGLTQLMDYLHLEAGEIFLRREESKTLQMLTHRGETVDNFWKRTTFLIGESTVGRTASSGNPVVLNLSEYEYADLNPITKTQGVHQLAVLPMTGRRGVVGVLCVATCHPQPLDDLEVQFVQAISSWMATAIENVHLNESGKRLAVLEERDRFGMDLHDGIIQSIYAVGLTLEHARLLIKEDPAQSTNRIEQAIKDLNHTIRDIRAYILDLRPRQLNNENLMQGIQRLVQEFRANTLIDVSIQGPDDEMTTLPETQAMAFFHICQEALANIAKHAKARRVAVVVWTTHDRALLEVRDDGRGFDSEKVKLTIGHGLSNMASRATNAGGEVDITSDPGNGTSVLAWLPLPDLEPLVIE
ncbi:MAG: GAF domain-containing sensor histidine kinase [Chloroflexi bacterium]|nr:GAF domain-containing sensor histidine kinase [Chloroflexota bacterium]